MAEEQRQARPAGAEGWRRVLATVAAGGASALLVLGLLWTATRPLEQARPPPGAAVPGSVSPGTAPSGPPPGPVVAAPEAPAAGQSVDALLAEVDALMRQADALDARLDRIAQPDPALFEDPLAALPEARVLAATPAAAPLPLAAPEPAAVPRLGPALSAAAPDEGAPRRVAMAPPPPPPAIPAAPASAAAPAPSRAASAAGQRCRSIIVRVQLGEEPSYADRRFLRGGCR